MILFSASKHAITDKMDGSLRKLGFQLTGGNYSMVLGDAK